MPKNNGMEAPCSQGSSSPAPAPSVKLRLTKVTKTFETLTQTVEALAEMSFEVKEGEYVVFFGPSGCGKSTLLNMIAGFEAPSTGEILLDEKPVSKPGPDRLMMFQEHALFPWLTVAENVIY